MRVVLLVGLLVLINDCGARIATDANSTTVSSPNPTVEQTPEHGAPDVPIIPVKTLSHAQQKELDSTLPAKVRHILEKADNLEVMGMSSEDKVGIGWFPDVSVSVPTGARRTELLNAFYFDASAGDNPTACFLPRHGLKATYKGKTVEVIICFQCHLFTVRGDLGEFDGGIYINGSASHHLFESILQAKREQTAR